VTDFVVVEVLGAVAVAVVVVAPVDVDEECCDDTKIGDGCCRRGVVDTAVDAFVVVVVVETACVTVGLILLGVKCRRGCDIAGVVVVSVLVIVLGVSASSL
jgi:hypothetical protein